MSFKLCDDCLATYRALVFDPAARHAPCLMPYVSLVWPDEEPPLEKRANFHHTTCVHSLIRLNTARKRLWRTGCVSPEDAVLWQEAQKQIPDWPGFRRLKLTVEELRALNECEQETAEMIGGLRQDASVFSVDDQGDGVVRFTAHPRVDARPGDPAGERGFGAH